MQSTLLYGRPSSGRCDQRITRSGAGTGAKPVQEPRAQHSLPVSRQTNEWFGDCCQHIAGERY
jgi:hypothetical protein